MLTVEAAAPNIYQQLSPSLAAVYNLNSHRTWVVGGLRRLVYYSGRPEGVIITRCHVGLLPLVQSHG